MTLPEMLIRLGIDGSSISQGLLSVRNQVSKWADDIKKTVTSSFGDAFKGIVAAFGIQKIFQQLNELGEMARRLRAEARALDVSTSTLQALPKLIKKAGGNPESAERGLRLLSEKIGDARISGDVKDFEKWGIALNNANGVARTTDQILDQIMDKMKGTGDATLRAAMAHDLFGRAGKEMSAALMQGAEALEKKKGSWLIYSDNNLAAMDRGYSSIMGLGKAVKFLATQVVLFPASGFQKLATLIGAYSVRGQTKEGLAASLAGATITLDSEKANKKAIAEQAERDENQMIAEFNVGHKERMAKRASLDEQINLKTKDVADLKEIEAAQMKSGAALDDKLISQKAREVAEGELQELATKKKKQQAKIDEHEAKLTRDIKENRDTLRKSEADALKALQESFKPTLEQVAESGWWKHRKGGRKWTWMQTDDARNANDYLDLKEGAEQAYLNQNTGEGDRLTALAIKAQRRLSPAVRSDSYLADIAKATSAADDRLGEILVQAQRTADALKE